MPRSNWRTRCAVALMSGVVWLAGSPAGTAGITNGDLETGDFSGWLTYLDGTPLDGWHVYQGSRSPVNGFQMHAPPQGRYAATTDPYDTSTNILYRDVWLDADAFHELEFTAYYMHRGYPPMFRDAGSLDWRYGGHEYRIDVMSPAASIISVAPEDIHGTLFRTRSGDPLTSQVMRSSTDLSHLGGQMIRVRAAVVAGFGHLIGSIDAVSLTTTYPTTTVAHPAIAELVPGVGLQTELSATVTNSISGAGIVGLVVDFSVGGTTVCTGTTDTDGRAACGGIAEQVAAALDGGFTATFAGTSDVLPSSDDGPVLVVDGSEVL